MPVPTKSSDPSPTGPPAPHPAESGLTSALDWYDREASGNRHAYQTLRLATIALAAAIPVLTTSHAPPLATAIVGATIVITEGVQQLFGFHERYVTFRAAWNALDRERRLYDSRAGRYADNAAAQQRSRPWRSVSTSCSGRRTRAGWRARTAPPRNRTRLAERPTAHRLQTKHPIPPARIRCPIMGPVPGTRAGAECPGCSIAVKSGGRLSEDYPPGGLSEGLGDVPSPGGLGSGRTRSTSSSIASFRSPHAPRSPYLAAGDTNPSGRGPQ